MKHNLLKTLLFFLFFFLVTPSFAGEGDTYTFRRSKKKLIMSLSNCVALTLKNNRTIKNAYLSRIPQRYDLRVAKDKFVPDLFINPDVKYNYSKTQGERSYSLEKSLSVTINERIPTGGEISFIWSNSGQREWNEHTQRNYSSSVELTFKQPLLKNAGIDVATASVKIAEFSEDINVLQLKSTLIDVITSAIYAYRNFYRAYKELEIAKNSLRMSEEVMSVNKALLKAGRLAKKELIQAEANLANDRFNLSRARNSFDAARLNLIKVLDIDRDTYIMPSEKVQMKPVIPPDLSTLKRIAFKNRPDYLAQLLNIEIARQNLLLAKNNRLWDLYIEGSYRIFGNDENDIAGAMDRSFNASNKELYVGLGLTIPFGDLTLKQGYLHAKINLSQEKINLRETEENIAIEVMDALRDVNMKLKQVELARRARELAEDKVRIEREKLRAGRSTNFKVLTFQNDLTNAQNNELSAKIDYANALTNLDRVLGTTLKTWGISVSRNAYSNRK